MTYRINSDIAGNWRDNQIPLCKWIDTGSHNIELELKVNKGNHFVVLVTVMACVEKEKDGVGFISRYHWDNRNLLESGNCSGVIEQPVNITLGNVMVSLGEDQRAKWEDTLTCDTGTIAYRKRYLMLLLLT